ncbi:MAG TPA: glycosyltransferase family 9 protein [Thermoanaerobaculaceae bacterium]|nr:glycosyltransferase family 9 protein [Thermoanaerobaculaceae bacterium]
MRRPGVGALPSRVLVDLPNWLGDLVHALPALAQLQRENRGGETWALLPVSHVPVARLLGVGVIERPSGAGFRFGRTLRGRFDVVVTARHSTRAKLLLAGTGSPLLLASKGRGAAALGLATFPVARSHHQRHDLDKALELLGLPTVGAERFLLPLPATLAALGRRHRRLLADGSRAVALLPATRGANGKRYPLDRFADVAAVLSAVGVTPVVVVGPGEEEVAAVLAGSGVARVAPTGWSLEETAALLAACDAAVGNDSGLAHLAAVVGCPTVTLFGPTDPARTAPVGSALVVRAPSPDGSLQSRSLKHLDPGVVACAVEALVKRAHAETVAPATFTAWTEDTEGLGPSQATR